eukprot:GHVP01024926.1.p1 GENE.GHVP01024926.1~~GHVP01024926.1.p1  ORF type:complete len:530 (-),score=73.83 GHVP01024926.1:990-2579(-)
MEYCALRRVINFQMNDGKMKRDLAVHRILVKMFLRKRVLGAQVAVCHHGELVVCSSVGKLGPVDSRPVQSNSLFCIFSVSQGILVTLLLSEIDKRNIPLDSRACDYWDGFIRYGKKQITLRHVLSHRTGLEKTLPRDLTISQLLNYEFMIRSIEDVATSYTPGERPRYSHLVNSYIIAELLRGITGKRYDELVTELVCEKINIKDDLFFPIPAKTGKIIADLYTDSQMASPVQEHMSSPISNAQSPVDLRTTTSEVIEDTNSIHNNDANQESNELALSISSRLATHRREVQFVQVSDIEISDKLEAAKSYAGIEVGGGMESTKFRKSSKKAPKSLPKNERTSPFELAKSKPYLLDPLIYDCKRVLGTLMPSMNCRASARAMALFYSSVANFEYFGNDTMHQAAIVHSKDESITTHFLTAGASRTWGLGYQLFFCDTFVDLEKVLDLTGNPRRVVGIGNNDIGGSVAMCFPELKLSLSVLVNDILNGAVTVCEIVEGTLRLFGLQLSVPEPLSSSTLSQVLSETVIKAVE